MQILLSQKLNSLHGYLFIYNTQPILQNMNEGHYCNVWVSYMIITILIFDLYQKLDFFRVQ